MDMAADCVPANERTFLGYLRTSIVLAMIGALIAQLYRLEQAPNPSDVYGYVILSKPLAVIFEGAALGVTLLGTCRFWRQQSAMSIGRVHAGGWELATIGAGTFLVSETFPNSPSKPVLLTRIYSFYS